MSDLDNALDALRAYSVACHEVAMAETTVGRMMYGAGDLAAAFAEAAQRRQEATAAHRGLVDAIYRLDRAAIMPAMRAGGGR